MKFVFRKADAKETGSVENQWRTVLLKRKLLAAAESSSSAASGRPKAHQREER